MFTLVHFYPILVAALLATFVGGVWYSPLMFGERWMKLRGVDPRKQSAQFPVSKMALEFVFALVTAFVLSLFTLLLPPSVYAASIFALVVWVGFYVTALLSQVLWENTPFELFLINAGARLVTSVVISLVLVLWRV